MTYILQAGDDGSVGHQDASQGQFRNQINAINDAVRQLGGKPLVAPGDTEVNDPLNLGYVLYVNPDIGSDKIVYGDYASSGASDSEGANETDRIMRRIRQQQLVCGYTDHRPFRTLNRAVIEAGILTSRDYHTDCSYRRTKVTIVISGQNVIYNGPGLVTDHDFFTRREYIDGQEIPEEDLDKFNPTSGGLILPRGCSLVSLDLRKTILTPDVVPCPVNETMANDVRMPILLTTGEGYYYGMTFMDCPTYPRSHHLLSCFEGASKSELDAFYKKIDDKFGGQIDFSEYISTDPREYQVVGPQPSAPTEVVDTTASASPYIYNCSIRSEYGLCGIDYDGDKVGGFRSLVTAQFTGVSLQRDQNAFQIYIEAVDGWREPKNYQEVIDTDPNNVRMKPEWGHFHIRASNRAVIQEVSVFAIGQNVHHWTRSGGEITITNSNSNFGGVAALSEGYHPKAQPQDSNWEPLGFNRARDPFEKTQSVKWIWVGRLKEQHPANGKTLFLSEELAESSTVEDQPDIIARLGYSLKENDYIWIRNTRGHDYRAKLAAKPWLPGAKDRIQLKELMVSDAKIKPGTDAKHPEVSDMDVFIRRFTDTRTEEERTYELVVKSNDEKRFPVRDYVVKDVANVWSDLRISAVAKAKQDLREQGFVRIELRNANHTTPDRAHNEAAYYHKGDTVLRDGKHFNSTFDQMGPWDPDKWQDSFKHMPSDYTPPGTVLNSHPVIIFDGDTDPAERSENCGFTLESPIVKAQYQSATDYKGLSYYMGNAGVATKELLKPQAEDKRFIEQQLDPVSLHRPSQIRLFGHAYEWAGTGNYSKALPQYQKTLTAANKWTFYQTEVDGGKNYISGFNEEGFLVTNNGLQDLETGESVDFANLGAPDRDQNTDAIVYTTAQTNNEGIVLLAEAAEAVPKASKESKKLLDVDINSSARAVTKPWLERWVDDQGYIKAPQESVAAVVIHCVPEGVTPLTGPNSVPYGYPAGGKAFTEYDEADYIDGTPPKTITEALRLASRIYVPNGAYIVISVHGDLTAVEPGPLQLVNSWAPIVVAGARGSSSQRGPKINLNANITKSATARFPQYSSVYAFSAGVLFADVHLVVDCVNKNTSLTFNGGLGIGAKDTTIEASNVDNLVLINASFGESATLSVYPDVKGPDRTIETIVRSAQTNPIVQFFGVDSQPDSRTGTGLTGHGIDMVIDFLNATYGGDGKTKISMKFTHDLSVPITLSWLNFGGRGGCRAGGRVAPNINLDLSAKEWNLEWWIGKAWRKNQNYFGRHFTLDKQPADANAFRAAYNMTQNTYQTIKPCELSDGSCIDITDENAFEAGPFCLYKNYEKGGGGSTGDFLWAKNNRGSYVYGSTGARNKDGDKGWD